MTDLKYTNCQIGEIVADDFRKAEIFKAAGLDFCCGGKKTLNEACGEKNLDADQIEKKLEEMDSTPLKPAQYFNTWSLDFLCDYIVNNHHQYVIKTLPQLVFYTKKIADVHGSNHQELIQIADLFGKINQELTQHLKKEEEVLFPAIKEALKINSPEVKNTIISEIERMNGEHEFAGGAMDQINRLSMGYHLPADACNTYQLAYKLLEQFEYDLHIHVHLENNILYPKALKINN
jgi:regulator of cell morphogenesis and NO signaling